MSLKIRLEQIKNLGFIEGFIPKYKTTTSIYITAGIIEANGKYYKLTSDLTHNMTSLASAFGRHYIYIDDSESSGSIPTIINSTTAPTYSIAKRGYYNGNDRMIGVVISKSGVSTVEYFDIVEYSNKLIEFNTGLNAFPSLASSMNPDETWQTPNINESDVVLPVNAVKMRAFIACTDVNAETWCQIANKEYADALSPTERNVHFLGYNGLTITVWTSLGISRKVRITGNDDDDNTLLLNCSGFAYRR